MFWSFNLPVRIEFGCGKRKNIKQYIDDIGGKKGVLVCSKSFVKNGFANEITEISGGRIIAVFSEIRPNPTTENVNECVRLIRELNADFAVALGGGSPMDCCKAA